MVSGQGQLSLGLDLKAGDASCHGEAAPTPFTVGGTANGNLLHLVMTGTNSGPMGPMPPTGKAIDIWGTHIPNHPGALYRNIDLIGATSYIGWYEFPFESHDGKQNLIRGRVARLRRVFPARAR